MTETTVPEFFREFPMRRVRAAELDEVLSDGHAGLDILGKTVLRRNQIT